jgi:excisionase family DNA binding protein
MFGHYLRVQEAALLLGVSPATVRWYSKQYGLQAYRIGQGQIQHRRFK